MKTYIIYLAAGDCRRFGSNKLIHKIAGKEVYRFGLENLLKLTTIRDDCKLIIVTEYFEIITAYPELDYIYTAKCQAGLAYSIHAGLEMISHCNAFQIMLVKADQIDLDYQTLDKMLNIYNDSCYTLATLTYQGQVGYPSIFDYRYRGELMKLAGNQDGSEIINHHQDSCLFYHRGDLNGRKG